MNIVYFKNKHINVLIYILSHIDVKINKILFNSRNKIIIIFFYLTMYVIIWIIQQNYFSYLVKCLEQQNLLLLQQNCSFHETAKRLYF